MASPSNLRTNLHRNLASPNIRAPHTFCKHTQRSTFQLKRTTSFFDHPAPPKFRSRSGDSRKGNLRAGRQAHLGHCRISPPPLVVTPHEEIKSMYRPGLCVFAWVSLQDIYVWDSFKLFNLSTRLGDREGERNGWGGEMGRGGGTVGRDTRQPGLNLICSILNIVNPAFPPECNPAPSFKVTEKWHRAHFVSY